MTVQYLVPPERDGVSVAAVLRRGLGLSAGLTRRLKRADAVCCNGQSVHADYRLRAGDLVTADIGRAESPSGLAPERGPLEVLWESPLFFAVNKPAGLLVHPSHARCTGTLANIAAGYLRERDPEGACHAVNRLDRDTSGVVLFAKSAYAMELGVRALEAGEKTYIAVICGRFDPPAGVIELPIVRPSPEDMRRAVAPEGQRAVTRYETLGSGCPGGDEISALRLHLETGRTHQIRVHCAACGHPLLGDRLYGTDASLALSARLAVSAQLLHARTLTFPNPPDGETVRIEAPVRRGDLAKMLESLEICP